MTTLKNEAAADLVAVLDRHRSEFESKNKGGNWRAIMFTIADTFPEDRLNILKIFKAPEAEPNPNPPKLRRGASDQAVSVSSSDCAGCPGAAQTKKSNSNIRVINTSKKGVFESVEDILERFESNPEAMKAWAEDQGIAITSKIKKPETIAQHIFEHYQKPGQ